MIDSIEEAIRVFNLKFNNDSCNLTELDNIASYIIEKTLLNYDESCGHYANLRTKMDPFSESIWHHLLEYIDKHMPDGREGLRLIEMGASSGRDIIYGQQQRLDIIGVEGSKKFYEILCVLFKTNLILNKPVFADLRTTGLVSYQYDIIRHNATLHHFPIIGKGYTFDKCIEESFRLLKNKGVLSILTKRGNSLKLIDTSEGLGCRCFQLVNQNELVNILDRNGFNVIMINEREEHRKKSIEQWLEVLAEKK